MGTRTLAALVAVIAAVSIGTAVLVIGGSKKITDPNELDLDPPSTGREKKAAAVALDFAARVRAGDVDRACELLAGAAARDFRCASRPRVPRFARIPPGQKLEVIDVVAPEVRGAVGLGIPVEGVPVLKIDVDRAGRVVHVTGYGYA